MAFDTLAPTYDQEFTHSPITRYLRGRVHTRLTQHFYAGDHVLEFGCGTGEDALYLARQGIHVTATDASEQMLAVARAKAANHPLIRFEQLDLRNLGMSLGYHLNSRGVQLNTPTSELFDTPQQYDGVFANFGVLNCLDDWRPLATWLVARVKPGGVAAFGVMSPLCLWEIVWHGLRGNFKTASRRVRKSTTFQPNPEGEAVPIRYPSVRRLTRDFASCFKRIHVEPLGLFLPPSEVYRAVQRRPKLLRTLTSLEARSAPLAALAPFADHYWIEFRRIPS